MFTIEVQKECGCFKKSEFENPMQFKNRDDALLQAKLMERYMNDKFCQKHHFWVEEADHKTLHINVAEIPLTAKQNGCCGGGHCS